MKSMIVEGRKKVIGVEIDYGMPKRKQLAIPDQALSLTTIVERFVRGVPVDVKHRQPVYVDQTEFDLERLGRAEFSEKMSIAEELRARFDAIEAAYQADEAKREEAQKQAEEVKTEPVKEPEKGSEA